MTTPAKKPPQVQTSASPAAPHPAATPAPDMDALPPGGGSYTRQPDGTLVPTPAADTTTPAPAWGPLLQACSMAAVITASTRVDYTPLISE